MQNEESGVQVACDIAKKEHLNLMVDTGAVIAMVKGQCLTEIYGNKLKGGGKDKWGLQAGRAGPKDSGGSIKNKRAAASLQNASSK